MHIRQLKSGTWRVIVQVHGVKRSGTAATRSAAERLGAQMILDAGGTPSATNTTVGELLDIHLDEHPYQPTTLADLKRVAAALPPKFRARKITDVEPVVIDGLYRQLTREGWSPHRIMRIHALLGVAFKGAKRRGWVHNVPTRDAYVPTPAPREDTTPEIAVVQQLLAAASGPFRLFLWLAATAGARRGELCALRWEDIDTTRGELRIRRAASYTSASGRHIGDVKTGAKGRRNIPLDVETLEQLVAHRAEQRANAPAGVGDTPWIFTVDYVNGWLPNYATQQFIELRDRLGLDTVRLHDIRHFVASSLVGGITDPRTAADQLGHAKTSMTLDRYSRPIDSRRREATDELRRLLRG